MPTTNYLRVSRMRETCTSGLRRGEEAVHAVPLLLDFKQSVRSREVKKWKLRLIRL